MNAMNMCKVLKDATGNPTGNVVTPRALGVYLELFEPKLPKGERDMKKAKYQGTLIFHKDAQLGPLQEAMATVISDNVSPAKLKETKLKKPFLKITQDDQPKIYAALVAAGYDPDDYPVMLRASNSYKPVLKNPDGSDCLDETSVYMGRAVRANVNFWFYDHEVGGKGVSASLNSVQLLDASPVIPRSGGGGSDGSEYDPVDVGGSGGTTDDLFA